MMMNMTDILRDCQENTSGSQLADTLIDPPPHSLPLTTHTAHKLMYSVRCAHMRPPRSPLAVMEPVQSVERRFFTHPGCCRHQSPSDRVSYRVI